MSEILCEVNSSRALETRKFVTIDKPSFLKVEYLWY